MMKNKWFKAVILLIIIGIVVIAAIYRFVYNKPHIDYAKAKPDFELRANECYNAFINDRQKAESLYNGKIVQITGMLSGIEQNDSLAVLVFVFNQGDFGDEGIRCTLLPGEKVKQGLTAGSQVTVKGLLTGYNDTDVILEHCSIIP